MSLLLVAACGQTTQTEVSYPAVALGAASPTFTAADGFQVTLTRADLGLGPLYFCAASQGSEDLCPTAVQELRASVTLSGLEPGPRAVGQITGSTGEVRSAIYDLGISWFTTDTAPKATAGAPDGHSAVFAGRATSSSVSVDFEARVDLPPAAQGFHAVNGQPARRVTTDDQQTLEIRFDPARVLSGLDYAALAATSGGQRVLIERGSVPHDTIAIALVSLAPLQFTWR